MSIYENLQDIMRSDPVIKKKCKDLNLLFTYLKEAIGFVSSKRISEADK